MDQFWLILSPYTLGNPYFLIVAYLVNVTCSKNKSWVPLWVCLLKRICKFSLSWLTQVHFIWSWIKNIVRVKLELTTLSDIVFIHSLTFLLKKKLFNHNILQNHAKYIKPYNRHLWTYDDILPYLLHKFVLKKMKSDRVTVLHLFHSSSGKKKN